MRTDGDKEALRLLMTGIARSRCPPAAPLRSLLHRL